MSQSELENTLLAVLFAVGEPIAPERLADALEVDAELIERLLAGLAERLDARGDALTLLRLGGQAQLATRPQYTPAIRRALDNRRDAPLTPAALEVLAAVAYNQPVTRAYIEQVRGVDSSGVVAYLTERGLLEEAGRMDLPGRPILYRTTPHFLRTFGLSSLDELPQVLPQEEPRAAEGQIEGQIDWNAQEG